MDTPHDNSEYREAQAKSDAILAAVRDDLLWRARFEDVAEETLSSLEGWISSIETRLTGSARDRWVYAAIGTILLRLDDGKYGEWAS